MRKVVVRFRPQRRDYADARTRYRGAYRCV